MIVGDRPEGGSFFKMASLAELRNVGQRCSFHEIPLNHSSAPGGRAAQPETSRNDINDD
jgi:hypothetical protein